VLLLFQSNRNPIKCWCCTNKVIHSARTGNEPQVRKNDCSTRKERDERKAKARGGEDGKEFLI